MGGFARFLLVLGMYNLMDPSDTRLALSASLWNMFHLHQLLLSWPLIAEVCQIHSLETQERKVEGMVYIPKISVFSGNISVENMLSQTLSVKVQYY